MSYSEQLPTSYASVNAAPTTDNWPSNSGLEIPYVNAPGAVWVNIIVENNPIEYQLGLQRGGGVYWLPERYLPISVACLRRRFDVIRARSWTTGHPATVTLEALVPSDLGLERATKPNGGAAGASGSRVDELPDIFVWR